MLELISITKLKDVFHVLMDAWDVPTVTNVLNADLNTPLSLQLDFVNKFVVMDSDSFYHVMTETTLMAMDAAETVNYKSDSHVMVDLQIAKTHAPRLSQVLLQLLQLANLTYMVRSF